jgi:hypothetical protein
MDEDSKGNQNSAGYGPTRQDSLAEEKDWKESLVAVHPHHFHHHFPIFSPLPRFHPILNHAI